MNLLLHRRQNLLLYSEDLSKAAWSTAVSGVTGGATTSPNPLAQACKIVESAGNFKHGIYQAVTAAGASTFSVYLKSAERSFGYLQLNTDAGILLAFFDLSGAVIGTVDPLLQAAIKTAGNGWNRVTARYAGSSISYVDIGIASADNAPTYNGDGASGIYAWGAQLRPGGIARYVKTTSVAG